MHIISMQGNEEAITLSGSSYNGKYPATNGSGQISKTGLID